MFKLIPIAEALCLVRKTSSRIRRQANEAPVESPGPKELGTERIAGIIGAVSGLFFA
jgi:hypothetical protein